ncbi:MAG TPA: DEAD/DEAH box helicase [Polyangiaceae bacterium]|jgi:ATP-dependent RNA helicase DeaD
MDDAGFGLLRPAFAGALEKKGFKELTSVQRAVLDPALAGRDLRITSQTGSGKTVAIGLVVADSLTPAPTAKTGIAQPTVIVVTPTRELAKQVEEELAWLYAPVRASVTSVTGGASIRDERRALAAGPNVVVGTPGRLLDHLTRGSIDATRVDAMVLDEADRMLDLGFRDDLLAILDHAPKEHRTHLVSATFPRDVRALADRVQRDPAHVEGTKLGTANTDIEHVIHVVDSRQRLDAIVNLLLATPDAQTLVFARTRADVAHIARDLEHAGFSVASLSGEMEQPARNRALAAFKRGALHALVATDVAARGIDVQDIARVIHAEAPSDADSYTHRSGRTGRAGRKGTSSILVTPGSLGRATSLLKRAGVRYRIEPIPTADMIRTTADERLFEELTQNEEFEDERAWALAKRISKTDKPTRALARLLARVRGAGPAEPREVRPIAAPPERHRDHERERRRDEPTSWASFRVSWGQEHGADARRLLAMLCRRGNVRGSDIGAIRVLRSFSTVNVAADVAESFFRSAQEPDPRNPRVTIRRDSIPAERPSKRATRPSR